MAPAATRTSAKAEEMAIASAPEQGGSNAADERQLPITLLGGFLGSGKSTLLEHILRSEDHGMKVAVIVHDMGELNIDAALLAHHNVALKPERVVVKMQNGGICCTLRGDLLEEVADLAMNRNVDYLLIESSGISEPIGLSKTSRLDTCVAVVDAVNVLSDFDTADFHIDRQGRSIVPEEDGRTMSDPMTDQLEFSNVVIANKTGLVQPDELAKFWQLIHISTHPLYGKIDPKEVLETKLVNYEKATVSAGWMQSLQEKQTTETVKYDIASWTSS